MPSEIDRKFRKKPVVIEATQWFKNGDHPQDDCEIFDAGKGPFQGEGKIVRHFRRPDVSGFKKCEQCGAIMNHHGWIDTLEGGHNVCPGDWIITGVQGEHYPCKPDIFEATYEPAALARTVEAEPRIDSDQDQVALERLTSARSDIEAAISAVDNFSNDVRYGTPDQQAEIDRLRARVAELERERDEAIAGQKRQIEAGYCDAQWLSDGPPFKCGWQHRAEVAESRLASQERAPDERKANARLIAAAPDMLEALNGLIRFRNWELAEGGVMPADLISVWKDAESAIAKAEGRQP